MADYAKSLGCESGADERLPDSRAARRRHQTDFGTRQHLIMAVLDRREATSSPAEQIMLDDLADELIRYALAGGH